MKTVKAIKERRSIRAFTNENVNKDLIEDILNCGRLAPSAKNKQPWFFAVVEGALKNEIADMMIEDTKRRNAGEEKRRIGFCSSVNPTALVMKEAPVLILIFREKDDNWVVGDNLSIGACVENMCLRATELNLGTLWIRDIVYVAEDVAAKLNHANLELNCAVSLGYPNQFPKPRPRKKLTEIVEWYK